MVQSFDSDQYPNFYGVKETDQLKDAFKTFKSSFTGTFIANNNLTIEKATELVENKSTDLVSFGRAFLANPDLVERFLNKQKLNEVDYSTAYHGGEKGYNDYPKFK